MTASQPAPVLPSVGDPATILLYTDARPAVVVKVNAKSVVVEHVEVFEHSKRQLNPGEPIPCLGWDGDLAARKGVTERFKLVGYAEDGTPRYRNGSISLSLGRSVKITDYRQ